MKVNFSEIAAAKASNGVLVLLVGEDKKLSAQGTALDKQCGGALSRALSSGNFSGKRGQLHSITPPKAVKAERILLVGTGKASALDAKALQGIGGCVVPAANMARATSLTLLLEDLKGCPIPAAQAAAHIAHGARLRAYNFDKYHTKKKPEEKPTLVNYTVALAGAKNAAKPYADLEKLGDGMFLTRDLVNEPANIVYPESMAQACEDLEKLGLEVQVLDEPEMYELGFGALLGVGQGSARESKMVILRWNGLGKNSKSAPLAFVGKGVTFDTGGISIKPAGGMEEMKWDMGGAGAVVGLMATLAGRKAKVNAVGAIGLVENMPSGTAQRPGDVVTSYSGQTIEVLNTDAEGRLVLADVLWYTQKHYKPKLVVDLATLTGAIIVSLGSSRAGLFSNNDKLSEQLFKAGQKTGEELWRLPLGDVYDKMINSDIADMQNIGKDREAGSITAAQFLQRFIMNDTPWAHLDIAGVAWSKKDADTCPKGATAFGVNLLNQFVADFYEGK
ncbi:MAG: leucyl aminopeptidase [Proteobacteria bacterium]|nr:leucyl aminopeptidase [Pseudomonadota bacterium]